MSSIGASLYLPPYYYRHVQSTSHGEFEDVRMLAAKSCYVRIYTSIMDVIPCLHENLPDATLNHDGFG